MRVSMFVPNLKSVSIFSNKSEGKTPFFYSSSLGITKPWSLAMFGCSFAAESILDYLVSHLLDPKSLF